MNLFTRLPGFVETPPGLERKLLRRMPKLLLFGSLLIATPSFLARIFPWDGSESALAELVTRIDIYVISVVVLHWTVLFTVALGAFIVLVIKGPAYVADAYPLEDSDTPDCTGSRMNQRRG